MENRLLLMGLTLLLGCLGWAEKAQATSLDLLRRDAVHTAWQGGDSSVSIRLRPASLDLTFARFSTKDTRYAARLTPAVSDWSGWPYLILGLSNPAQDSLYLGILIEDEKGHRGLWHELIGLGQRQEVVVPLPEMLAEIPAEQRPDLRRIRSVELFIRQPKLFEADPHSPVLLRLDTLRLEQRALTIAEPELSATPGLPARLLLQAHGSLEADWHIEVFSADSANSAPSVLFNEAFLRAQNPRWMVSLPGPGSYLARLQARRGKETAERRVILTIPETPAGPALRAWAQPATVRPDHYALEIPPVPAEAMPLTVLAEGHAGLMIPLLASRPLQLKPQVNCPSGYRCRLYRVGWLQAWRPQELYRIGRPGWIADALQPVAEGEVLTPRAGQLEALYLELQAPPTAKQEQLKLRLDWGEGQQTLSWELTALSAPGWRQQLPETAFSLYTEYFDTIYKLVDPKLAGPRYAQAVALLDEHHLALTNIYQPPLSPARIDALLQLLKQEQKENPQARFWFNLGYLGPGLLAERLPGIKAAYAHLKELHLADRAYIFAFDEFQGAPDELRLVCQTLQAELPGVPVISTSRLLQDRSLKWPANLHWSPSLRDFALYHGIPQADWGYVFIALRPPYPNWFLESDLIEARLIPWLAWQQGLNGLLYYTTNRWNTPQPPMQAEDFPLLPWIPHCFEDTNGDGCLIYPGHDGILASLRLKQLQLGLEDWALLRLAQARLGREVVNQMVAPLIRHPGDFSPDPQLQQAIRDRLLRELAARELLSKDSRQADEDAKPSGD